MSFSDGALRISLLFLPGIICHLLLDAIIPHRKREWEERVLHSFVLGMLSYLAYSVCYGIVTFVWQGWFWWNAWSPPKTTWPAFLRAMHDTDEHIEIPELLLASLAGVVLSLLLAAAINNELWNRLAGWLKVSTTFGAPNVWMRALKSKQNCWANIRDLDAKRMYQGEVREYSDCDEVRDIYLADVSVFDEVTGDRLYHCERLLVSIPPDKVHIEFADPSDPPEPNARKADDSARPEEHGSDNQRDRRTDQGRLPAASSEQRTAASPPGKRRRKQRN